MLIVQHDDKNSAGTHAHTHARARAHTVAHTTIMPRKGQRLKELSSVDRQGRAGRGGAGVDMARAMAGKVLPHRGGGGQCSISLFLFLSLAELDSLKRPSFVGFVARRKRFVLPSLSLVLSLFRTFYLFLVLFFVFIIIILAKCR